MAWTTDNQPATAPTSMAIDTSRKDTNDLKISVGFLDGSFGVYVLDRRKRSMKCRYMRALSTNGTVTAIAFSFPYIVTMTEAQLLSLYSFAAIMDEDFHQETLGAPRLLSSLKSHTAWPPLSLAIRCSSTGISTSIAYAMPMYLQGWSVGLQELRLTNDGTILESRLATPLSQGFVPLSQSETRSRSSSPYPRSSFIGVSPRQLASSSAKPTSLSYTHPYLLVAHSDNTMKLYMVISNAQELSIGPGTLLCGHTSSVSGAYVGDRGKAVSVSAHGSDLRVWELEGGMPSTNSRRRTGYGETSVVIRPDRQQKPTAGKGTCYRNEPGSLAANDEMEEPVASKGWLSFDEEQVVLLGERRQGAQTLVAYNFA
ncbi:MAG: hypothetical protein Q9170_000808 [Blastenia crenularia]